MQDPTHETGKLATAGPSAPASVHGEGNVSYGRNYGVLTNAHECEHVVRGRLGHIFRHSPVFLVYRRFRSLFSCRLRIQCASRIFCSALRDRVHSELKFERKVGPDHSDCARGEGVLQRHPETKR